MDLAVIQSIYDQDEYLVGRYHVNLHPVHGRVTCDCGSVGTCAHINAVMKELRCSSVSEWASGTKYKPSKLGLHKVSQQVRGRSID